MKHNFTLLLLVIHLPYVVQSQQWQSSGSSLYYNGGNVGIGIQAPLRPLHLLYNTPLQASDKVAMLELSTQVSEFNSGAKHGIRFSATSLDGAYSKMTEILNVSESGWNNANGLAFHTGGDERLRISSTGRVGIGESSPVEKLHVNGNIAMPVGNAVGWDVTNSNFIHNGNAIGAYSLGWHFDPWYGGAPTGNFSGYGGIKFFTNNQMQMVIQNQGNVGIGTTQADARLTVKGAIHTEEVRVDMNVPAPDYVFEKDYNLLPLSELEAYINRNKHLPEVPSAKEMEENGLNLKEMNLLLLKKVEELTLHLIEANKRIDQQQAEIVKLKETIKD